MDIQFTKDAITFDKELSDLDLFVKDFVRILDEQKIRYVLISGYVSILFGRNRSSEDIDIFIEPLDETRFLKLWSALAEQFECIITSDAKDAYAEYLLNHTAIRFSRKGSPLPNMELKFPKHEVDAWQLVHRRKVVVNGSTLWISTLESQIAFKLLLGSDKDFEDARYLFRLFSQHLDEEELLAWCIRLDVQDEMEVLR